MKETIDIILNECLTELDNNPTQDEIQSVKVKFLGKNGRLTALLKGLKDLSPQEKPLVGQLVNLARERIEAKIAAVEEAVKQQKLKEKIESEYIDITADFTHGKRGALHPLSMVNKQLMEIFSDMGFVVKEGPEVETDYYNFQALNTPLDHPARDMQDTFYITESILLRTHTSPNQVRVMEQSRPPIKMICPGKCYRVDDDATHSPIFNQIEGLVVDKNVTLCDLKGTIEAFSKKFFSDSTKVRLRPSFFPFTEPSVEVDLTCSNCGGKGCRLCKGTGWLEVLGAGMVNPFVLDNCGIDSQIYSGFAFGFGIDRMTMIKYGISDIRLMYQNDIRFLQQIVG
ncbi:MAG: phenylalanine--tRNA ligase subunit alpha [Clostridia bacterium]|nr:phenylalanine--tRNA ligase subunit alpha [Clostridia bacterium]